MHKCVPSTTLLLSLKRWTTLLLIGSAFVLISVIILSAICSNNFCDKVKLASAALCMIESINRFCLFIALWNSESFIIFCTVGVCILGSSLLALTFIETTFLPVQSALKDGEKGNLVTKAVRVAAILSGVFTLRLLSSGFCGKG